MPGNLVSRSKRLEKFVTDVESFVRAVSSDNLFLCSEIKQIVKTLNLNDCETQMKLRKYLRHNYVSSQGFDSGKLLSELEKAISSDFEQIIYAIEGIPKEPVQYTDDVNCREVGKIRCSFPSSMRETDLKFTTQLEFGDTEILAKVAVEDSKYSQEAVIKFM